MKLACKVYDRQLNNLQTCTSTDEASTSDPTIPVSTVETMSYQNGYLVEGRSDGTINSWAV